MRYSGEILSMRMFMTEQKYEKLVNRKKETCFVYGVSFIVFRI
jgi:hypothetical protein